MINNNETTNVRISEEVQKSIENYKNQATVLGLEVNRLEKLKAQIEITISNLSEDEGKKTIRIETLKSEVEILTSTKNKLMDEKVSLEKENVKTEEKRKSAEKDIKDRQEEMNRKENEFTKKELVFNDAKKKLAERIKENETETEKIEKKKKLLAEIKNQI